MSPVPRRLNVFFPPLRSGERRRWRRRLDAILRWIGPTWRASPLRRILQTVSFGLFVYLLFYVSWPYGQEFTSTLLSDKEWIPAELFLCMDPLVGLSTSIAARAANSALIGAAAVLALSVLVPRGFCAFICPLGTLIDLFDWLIGRPAGRLGKKGMGLFCRNAPEGTSHKSDRSSSSWWIHLKYYVLAAVLVAAGFGVLLSGFVSAIPVLTRGMVFTLGALQVGWLRNWAQVREFAFADWLSVGLFVLILLCGVLRPRFWCRHVCPSGAVFSLFGVFRLTQRQVQSTCVECGKCVEACPFDAIVEDYGTRTRDCAWCQTCGGVCPAGAIQFVGRFAGDDYKEPVAATTAGPRASRRGFLLATAAGAAAAYATGKRSADGQGSNGLIRPPGSVPEPEFLDLCIRCGECFQVCPGPVLQPAGWDVPREALWTPVAVPTHAGCHQDCNFCTQVCPTGAIRPLSIGQKRKTPMGLAVIDPKICLPHAGREDCRLCIDECNAAGYRAIELRRIELPMVDVPEGVFSDVELEQMSHIDAPFVAREACVGCGLCEYRCHAALVKQEKLLDRSAVCIVAENTDR